MFFTENENFHDKKLVEMCIGDLLRANSNLEHPDNFYKASVQWNGLSRFNGEFGEKDTFFYLTTPNLIISEIKETLTAITTSDSVEVIDGLLDIYWELAPVVHYFKPVRRFMKELNQGTFERNYTNFHSINFLEMCEHFINWQREVPDVNIGGTVNLTRHLMEATINLLHHLLHSTELAKAYTEVVHSNFSKFLRLSEDDLDYLYQYDTVPKLEKEAKKILGEQGSWAVCVAKSGYELPWGFITLEGKIKKPSTFIAPNLAEVLTIETLARINEELAAEQSYAAALLQQLP